MSAYDLDTILKKWERAELSTEQAIGQILLAQTGSGLQRPARGGHRPVGRRSRQSLTPSHGHESGPVRPGVRGTPAYRQRMGNRRLRPPPLLFQIVDPHRRKSRFSIRISWFSDFFAESLTVYTISYIMTLRYRIKCFLIIQEINASCQE